MGTLWGTTLTLFLNEEQFKKAVAYYRTNLEDNAGARVWAKRETYESSRFADVEEGIPFSWLNCLCGESVFMLDMRQHLKYGVVCIDCYEVIRQRYTERAQSAAGKLIEADEEFEADNKLVKLNDQDARNLESWARCASIHNRMTLSAVAQKANLSIDAVDFLLFHTDAIAADFGKNTRTFKTDLEALYKEFSLSIWEDFGDLILRGEDPEEAEGGRNELDDQIGGYGVYSSYTVKKPGGISEVWYLCENHRENFRSGDSCPECDRQEGVLNDPTLFSKMQCDECGLSFKKWQLNYHEKENYYLCEECNTYFDLPCEVQREALGPAIQKAIEAHTGGSTLSDLKRCGTCKTFVSSKYPCRLCEARETEEPKRVDIAALTNVDPATLGACVGGGDKKCKRKVVYCIGSMGVYCKRHFEKCSHTKCDKDANTVLKDNTRVCHGHARGQSGAMADKALQKLDMVFTEVK